MFTRFCIALLIVFGMVGSTRAQEFITITEAEYRQLLRQTHDEFGTALSNQDAREEILQANTARWQNVTAVRVDNGVVPVDTSWLQLDSNADGETIQVAMRRITALEGYSGTQGISLDGLGFDDEPVPTPIPPRQPPELRSPIAPAFASFAQMLLIAVGIVGVVALLFAIARGLTFKTAVTPIKVTEEDDPQTANDARERAKSSEKMQDYRAAVRYLYLSSLLMLDESGLIRYDPTLTNQEHLVQIDDRPNLKQILTPIINFFDRTWYGFAPISDDDYQNFRRQVNQLHKLAAERQK